MAPTALVLFIPSFSGRFLCLPLFRFLPQPGPIATETEGGQKREKEREAPPSPPDKTPTEGVPVAEGEVPPPVPSEESPEAGGTGRAPHTHAPQPAGPARPGRLLPPPASPARGLP